MSNTTLDGLAAPFLSDVLIVDDDAVQCEEMAGFLGRSGLDIHMAFSAATALRDAFVHRPRVALLDYNLPDSDGVKLAEYLRKLLPDTAILIMSGRIDGVSEQTLKDLGITLFVNKPVPLGPLRQAVLRLVARARPNRSENSRDGGWLRAGIGGSA